MSSTKKKTKTTKKTRVAKRDFWHKQHHVIHSGIFDCDILVAVNLNKEEILEAFLQCGDPARRPDFEDAVSDWGDSRTATAHAVSVKGGGYAMFLTAHKDRFREFMGRLVHESNHIMALILNQRDTPLTPDTWEVYAYLQERIVRESIIRLWD